MSDGYYDFFPAEGSGYFDQGAIWYFEYPGYHWVKVLVIDYCGNESNELSCSIVVYQCDDGHSQYESESTYIQQVFPPSNGHSHGW